MLGRVAAVFLSLSLLSSASFGQCSYPARYSGQFRSTVYDVAPDGTFLWTATGHGVQLLEPTSRGPEVVDAVALPGSTRVIAPRGTDLAYAGSGSKIVVLRRNGRSLDVVRSVDAPGTVTDIALTSTHLFAATRNGIAHYDLLDASNPTRTSAVLTTSRPIVTSLAIGGTNLYAADGDATVEVFNISIPSLPQRTGTIDTLPRAGAVHVGSEGFLYVSDEIGQNTDIFGGSSLIRRVPYGSNSLASATSGALFVSGGDRTIRAVDLSDPSRPIELFERQLAPTGGTSNGIFALARSGNTLYAAAGDIGLVSFDVSSIALPYPLVHATSGATTSALIIEGSSPKAYFSNAAGTITETSLQLATLRTSTSSAAPIVHDSRGSDLVTANGANASIRGMDGVVAFEATFRANVTDAILVGDTIIALLADQSVWSVKTTSGSTPQQIDTGGAKISYLARAGATYALAEVTAEGKTVIHFGSSKFTADGAATGGLALSATKVAFFTFRGLNVMSLTTGEVDVLPGSTNVIPTQLIFAGDNLLVLGERTLNVWNTATRSLARSHPLPGRGVAMHAGAQRVAIATDEGMLILDYLARLPEVTSQAGANRYYSKAVAGRERLYLFSSDGVDVYSTVSGLVPRFVAAIAEPGLIDLAAGGDVLYTLGSDATVRAYSAAGALFASTVLQYGVDLQPIALFTAGDAVWATISTGCRGGGSTCEKWTLVLDPRTLAMNGVISGAAVDVSVSGTRAYALLDVPREVVAFDISKPLLPAAGARITAPAGAVSLAATGTSVLVLGDKLYRYNQSLAANGTFLDAAAVSDEEIKAVGGCVVVIGRKDDPEVLDATSMAAAPTIEIPSTARSIAPQGTRLYILTDHSIEVWAPAQPSPTKRRAAR